MKYYLKDNFYYDIDLKNQLRIAGPQNHLLLGMSLPLEIETEVVSAQVERNQLVLELRAHGNRVELTVPLVTDIRTLRSFTEPVHPTPSYTQMVEEGINEVLPQKIEEVSRNGRKYISFKNEYEDETGIKQEYGAMVGVEKKNEIHIEDNLLILSGKEPLTMWIETLGTVTVPDPLTKPIFQPSVPLPEKLFSPELEQLYNQAAEQIEYLIRTKKTSGFEYGTIFPRDWIESADLGKNDLSQESLDFMYKESIRYVSETGEAWHEDLVGQYKTKIKDQTIHIDRKMIDIEPKYLLGFRVLSTGFLMSDEVRAKFKLVAKYIINNAQKNDLITFKRITNQPDQYHFIGNWRDSYYAFPRQKSPLGPYDVNCVLYPEALKIIREHADYFEVNPTDLDPLITKWDKQKHKFRLYHPGDIIGYSLALHGKKSIPLPIAHTDEAYDLFYASPSMEEVVSFARKIMNEEYFYTPVGPTLVARDEDEFTVQHYHGKVIWPKQSAYCVAGLTKQYFRGTYEEWPEQVLAEIKQAALTTAEASFAAFLELQAIPELYYYDTEEDRARLYVDQAEYEGQMSIIQLWSSVGARRMMRDYAALQGYRLTQEI